MVVVGNADNVIWKSSPTTDLPETTTPVSSVVNGGSILITEPVKKIVVSHVDNDAQYGFGLSTYQGSAYPNHVCIEYSASATNQCFAMTDNTAELYRFDLHKSTPPTKINTTMILNGEGATYRSSDDSIYRFHQPVIGNSDPTDLYKVEMDGTVTLIKASFLSEAGVGAEFVRYADGTERLIVLQHQYDSKILLFDAQNLASATPLSTIPLVRPDGSTAKVSGLAVNPASGEILVVDDAGGSTPSTDYPEIYSVDLSTGQLTLKTTLTVPGIDAESLAFAEDGELYTENDKDHSAAVYRNKIYRIDLSTGNLTAVEENIDTVVSGDIEGMSCTGSKIFTPPTTVSSCPYVGSNRISELETSGTHPWPGDPSINYTINYTSGANNGFIKQEVTTKNEEFKTTGGGLNTGYYMGGGEPFTVSIDFSSPIPVNEIAASASEYDYPFAGNDAGTLTLTGGTASTQDFQHFGWHNSIYTNWGNYNPSTGRVTVTGLDANLDPVIYNNSDNPHDGSYVLVGNSDKTVSRIVFSSGTMHTGDWVYFGLYYVGANDYGDAPNSYSTQASSTGAAHELPRLCDARVYMGSAITDFENDGQPGTDASSDDTVSIDDEDGITTFPVLDVTDSNYSVDVTVTNDSTNAATLYGWIDFDLSGIFEQDEAASVNVPAGSNAGTVSLNWNTLGDITNGDSYIRLRLTTDASITTATPGGLAEDGEVEDYPLEIVGASCAALTGNINSGLSPNKELKNNEKLFLATTTLTPAIEGHLNAYTINSEGAIATPDSSLWDAASQMTSLERASRLWSTDSSGSKILFNELDAAAFASNGIPDVASIKSFTLNPSHDYPVYIGERRRDSFLGAISPNSNLVLIDRHVNPMEYLRESAYRTFYNNTVSARTKRILLTSDDGFLYAFNQSDGDLGWGWMPRTLAKALKEHSSFPNEHLMQGHLKKMDLKASGQYASYIVGSYQQGLGQYVLKLDSNNNLDSVIWDIDHKALNALSDHSPNQGEGAYFHDTNGKRYIAYVITDIGGSSRLYIKSLTDTTISYEVLLDFTATSTPFVMYDYGMNNSPAPSTLYLGDKLGNVHSATLFITGGELETKDDIQTDINDGTIASLDTTDSSPVLYLGASASSSVKEGFYLRAQSEDRLTVFKYDIENTAWIKHWTAFVDGAGKWNGNTFATNTEIQRFPSGSKISANAKIVANSIVLPVTHAPAGNACYGTAHYYLYSLTDGHLPVRRFYNATNDTEITSIINLGHGDAKQIHLAPLLGSDKIMGLGIATQKPDNTTGINTRLYINDPVATGVRGWKELH